ncbi:MAG: zinc-dependent metalloprotease [Chitinophagaceae bacterium]|nr:zinc-dependent metalloprotease [Chitinophagaceae bacterium]
MFISGRFALTAAGTLLAAGLAWAQQRPTTPAAPAAGATDTARTRTVAPARSTSGPKSFKELIGDKAKSMKGMFTVYEKEDRYYFEIPNAMMNRDILIVSRVSKSAAGFRGGVAYAGDQINETMIRFEPGPKQKVFLKTISVLERSSDSTGGMYWNVTNSNLQPISASFEVKGWAKDSATGVIIDMTDFINGDNEILFFDSRSKRGSGLAGIQNDKSYIQSVKAFPKNIELRTVKTYSRGGGAPGIPGLQINTGGSGAPVTLELNTSMVLLPEKPMQARYYDDRVGYFTSQSITDFDLNPQGIETVRLIKRFRMEPKPEDMEKYKRGELVEPANPLIYYIDPTTPKKWVPYLIQGVNDWQIAFEKAGFKNAIIAKEAPVNDSTWSLEDARHNAIVYKPSTIANASGPSVIDPRSGEIIETHINWYHNVMSLLRNWYMVQTAAVDPEARKMVFDDKLMGELIRFVSSHEVGHTLGLRHNFGSSSTVPVDKLRDKAWVEANGHTPSIMDYARFNYVAQPEDNISQVGLFPRIGDYDKWAIEWGYRLFPEYGSPDAELTKLNAWTIENLKNPRLWWGDGEGNRDDPRNQTEDLGDNSMKASTYGIKNLQRILPKLPEYTKMPNRDYDDLREMYSQITGQFGRYIGHVASNIGGQERTPKLQEQSGPIYNYTSKARQKEAMSWLQANVFKTPTWVIQPNINALTAIDPMQVVGGLQNRALSLTMNANTISKLLRAEGEMGNTTYTLTEMMNDLRTSIFSELATRSAVDMYRRQLQKSFTERIIGLVTPPQPSSAAIQVFQGFAPASLSANSDALSTAKAQLRAIQAGITAALPATTDAATKNHYIDLQDRIKQALQPK